LYSVSTKYLNGCDSILQIGVAFIQKVDGQFSESTLLNKQQSISTNSLFEPLGRTVRNTYNMM